MPGAADAGTSPMIIRPLNKAPSSSVMATVAAQADLTQTTHNTYYTL